MNLTIKVRKNFCYALLVMASRSNSCLVDHIGYDCDYQIRNNGIRISVTYPIYDDETETESGWIDKQTIKDDEDYSHYFNLTTYRQNKRQFTR